MATGEDIEKIIEKLYIVAEIQKEIISISEYSLSKGLDLVEPLVELHQKITKLCQEITKDLVFLGKQHDKDVISFLGDFKSACLECFKDKTEDPEIKKIFDVIQNEIIKIYEEVENEWRMAN